MDQSLPNIVDTLIGAPLQRMNFFTSNRRPKPRRMHRARHRVNYSLGLPLHMPTYLDVDSETRNWNPEFEASARRLARDIWNKTFKVGELASRRPQTRVPAESTFPLFNSLPPELQDEVWKSTLEPKIFRTDFIHEDELRPRDEISGRHPEGIVIKYGRCRMPNIPIFWVCRQSRRLAVMLYGDPQKGDLLFNPEIDSLRLDSCGPGKELGWRLIPPFTIKEAMPSVGTFVSYYLHLEPVPLPSSSSSSPQASTTFYRTSDCPPDDPMHDATCHMRGRSPDTRYYFGYSPSLLKRVRHVEIYVSLFEVILTDNDFRHHPAGSDGDPANIFKRFQRWTAPLPNLRRVALMFYADAGNLDYVHPERMDSVDISPPAPPPTEREGQGDEGDGGGDAPERSTWKKRDGPWGGASNPTQSWVSFVAALIGDRAFWPRLNCLDFVMENLDFSNKIQLSRYPNVRR